MILMVWYNIHIKLLLCKAGDCIDIYETISRMRLERKRIEDIEIRVTYYARVSTLKEEQDSSIEAQVKHFTEMINKNPNWTYVEGYVDRVRGESADNRMQFQQMIQDGYDGKFDLVLTKEVSRFARNTVDSLTYTRELLKHGVGVFFLTDNICTIEQDSELRLTIMSSIAQDEVRKLSERVKFGHRKAIERGHVLGNSRIFGYDLIDNKLVINESEAEMVKLVFETYATGNFGLRYIEDLLWDKGYRNRNGKKIHHNTLSGIITNPKYKGYFCGNKVKIVDYRTKEQKFLPQEEWIMYKDETGETVPAIVSEELWEQANAVFLERSTKVKATERSAKKTSPLSGKIVCGEHQEPFWRSSYSKRIHPNDSVYEWICRRKKRGKACDCPTIALYESELYSILKEVIEQLSSNIDEYTDFALSMYKSESNIDNSEKQIKILEERLSTLEKRKDKLLDLYTDEIITKAEFKERNNVINSSTTEIRTQIEKLKHTNNNNGELVRNLNVIKDIVKSWTSSDEENAREYIDNICSNIIDRIIVYPIDTKTMKLEIRLVFGTIIDKKYNRTVQRSGIMVKRMIPKLRMGNVYYTPENRDTIGELYQFQYITVRKAIRNQPDINITYNVYICI